MSVEDEGSLDAASGVCESRRRIAVAGRITLIRGSFAVVHNCQSVIVIALWLSSPIICTILPAKSLSNPCHPRSSWRKLCSDNRAYANVLPLAFRMTCCRACKPPRCSNSIRNPSSLIKVLNENVANFCTARSVERSFSTSSTASSVGDVVRMKRLRNDTRVHS